MMTLKKLNDGDHRTFSLIARAAFANPFSPEREALDRRIAAVEGDVGRDELFAMVAVRAKEALSKLGIPDLRHYGGEDRELLRHAYLFDVYHRYREEFDGFIRRQIAAGDVPCRSLFAREVLSDLTSVGFENAEALRYLAIFYQIRRAFYFIDGTLAGLCPSMQTLRRHLWDNIFTSDIRRYEKLLWNRMEDFSTLLLGETGTGKGAAAAAIGRSGFIPYNANKGCFAESFTRNFIHLNLSQYPETLIESELFGHRKGAFTGAIGDYAGAFSRCPPHGTIFLDEIGDLSLPVQTKLLQVLQDRVFYPVGSHEQQRFNGRVIAATNRPLETMRRDGRFRDDFYYRLCSDILVMPPLRQRLAEDPGELEAMVRVILLRMLGGQGEELVDFVCSTLVDSVGPIYHWPGNVRELEQAIRRILVTGHYQGEAGAITSFSDPHLLDAVDKGTLGAQQLLAGYCQMLYRRHGTIEAVARCTGLDRRTVKKHLG
ncbi:sigma-54-dependent transcriptional regulator [Syntrophotalea carbinolica DSM 2380]|uniref:Sigma-54-dependent transcriptional regulator n=1 Tax=Syntrophotalea carbinolica (strain DSM 2380 / NBRC 103641 / GraBd1) TaxID=338963 RepID=Q3A0U8_SYNC1|nr:sigma 54-interacting transcriptional regulator [Syntrophotalea carbinolica]ABA90009.2 sigma-54-dependent transcriptional regulator [Syntrophotalea carbinolica DSM 2380]